MNSHALQSDKVATLEQFVAKSVITVSSWNEHNKILLAFGFQMKIVSTGNCSWFGIPERDKS